MNSDSVATALKKSSKRPASEASASFKKRSNTCSIFKLLQKSEMTPLIVLHVHRQLTSVSHVRRRP